VIIGKDIDPPAFSSFDKTAKGSGRYSIMANGDAGEEGSLGDSIPHHSFDKSANITEFNLSFGLLHDRLDRGTAFHCLALKSHGETKILFTRPRNSQRNATLQVIDQFNGPRAQRQRGQPAPCRKE
jgi:hypothetical protein